MRRALLACLLLLSPLAHAGQVDELLRAGRISEAVDVARADALAHPADAAIQETWIDLMLSLGLPNEVQTSLGRRAKQEPDSALVHYLVGRAATDIPASVEAYERALRIDPDHARSYMGLGAVERATGAWREAADMYQRALKLDGHLGEAWAGLLATVVASGDRATAIQVARAALAEVPDLAEAWLAVAAYEPETAGATLRQAVLAAPDDARVHAALSEYLLGQGKAGPARDEAEQALRLDPLHTGAALARMFASSMAAGTLDVNGYKTLVDARGREYTDPDAVRTIYDALVKRYPRSPLPWMARAGLTAPTDASAARADLERALALDPANDEARAALGLLLIDKDPARAAELLGPVQGRRPYDPTLTRNHASALYLAGDLPGAIAAAAAGERRFPYDLRLAVLHVSFLSESGDKPGAYEAGTRALARIPDPRLTLAVAAAARDAGRLRDAADLFEAAARQTGKTVFADTAAALRKQAAAAGAN